MRRLLTLAILALLPGVAAAQCAPAAKGGTSCVGPLTVTPLPGQSPTTTISFTAATAASPCPPGVGTAADPVVCLSNGAILIDSGAGYVPQAGPPGPPGSKGDPGAQGAPGVNGTNGRDGTNGTNGSNGANGSNGTNGVSPTIALGKTTTLAAGSSATVTNTGTPTAAVFNFGIPQGATGAPGKYTMPPSFICGKQTTAHNGTVTFSGCH